VHNSIELSASQTTEVVSTGFPTTTPRCIRGWAPFLLFFLKMVAVGWGHCARTGPTFRKDHKQALGRRWEHQRHGMEDRTSSSLTDQTRIVSALDGKDGQIFELDLLVGLEGASMRF
jgi:hypothetical protein